MHHLLVHRDTHTHTYIKKVNTNNFYTFPADQHFRLKERDEHGYFPQAVQEVSVKPSVCVFVFHKRMAGDCGCFFTN